MEDRQSAQPICKMIAKDGMFETLGEMLSLPDKGGSRRKVQAEFWLKRFPIQ